MSSRQDNTETATDTEEENISADCDISNTKCDSVTSDTSDVVTVDNRKSSDSLRGKHPQNFMELVEMIQKGMKLPDTEESNIEPLNEEPTPCSKERPKKPWEKT